MKVLVVEDDASLANALSEWLIDDGFSVRSAGSVPEALSITSAWHPDVVILDLGLGAMTGQDFLRLAPRYIDPATVRVIILTGDSRTPPEALLGAEAILSKPLDMNELTRLIGLPA